MSNDVLPQLSVPRTSDDRDRRPVLRDKASSVAARGEDEDGRRVLLSSGGDSGNGDGLDGVGGARGGGAELVVQRRVADRRLRKQAGLRHHED